MRKRKRRVVDIIFVVVTLNPFKKFVVEIPTLSVVSSSSGFVFVSRRFFNKNVLYNF